jgi:hypothetical protein
MAIRVPDPPPQGLEIIRGALVSLVRQPSAASLAITEAGPENLTVAAPHQVYFVGLRDIAEGRLLDAARLTGWRYIILDGSERAVAAAELSMTPDGRPDFSSVNRGPFVASTVEGARVAESLEVVGTQDFEFRLLDIPGLYVVALWLRGSTDIIIPLPPAREELEPLRAYSQEEVIGLLREPARRRLEFFERQSLR